VSATLPKGLSTHLACFGYELQPQPDGWTLAIHPVRYNFSIRAFDIGVRVHSAIIIGKELPNPRAWLAFINHANDTAILSRFAVTVDEDGDHLMRVRALLPAKYDRRTYGLLLEAWHEDLALLRMAPRATLGEADEEAEGEAAAPAITVN
jgi:hypothetical protein